VSAPTKPAKVPISSASASISRPSPAVTVGVAWIIPGAGHFLQGQFRKAAIFFVVLMFMFACGLAFGGREFSFQMSDPLIALASAAQWALGGPRLLAAVGGWGPGDLVATTYEYGNTFLIVAGLLNCLIALDAFDVASGRKARTA